MSTPNVLAGITLAPATLTVGRPAKDEPNPWTDVLKNLTTGAEHAQGFVCATDAVKGHVKDIRRAAAVLGVSALVREVEGPATTDDGFKAKEGQTVVKFAVVPKIVRTRKPKTDVAA